MKLTLFTISNEQIKEQLSKLQTKVESLETVKDVQDKIISAKDSQITFLQGEISSITTWVTWGAGVVITLASAAFIFIKLLENKAKKKIEEAENALQLATDKLGEIETARQRTETNLTESDVKIEQLNSLIVESNNIATIAQEKINELEEKQKLDIKLNSIKTDFLFLYQQQEKDRHICKNEQLEKFTEFTAKTSELEAIYILLSSKLNNKIIRGVSITDDEIQQVEKLTIDLQEFVNEYISFGANVKLLNRIS
ncbi:TPA: hypothetical protein QCX69_004250 [Bacillus anthracis]|nr:hypothetical protein [Bacillus anthracis]